MASNVRFLDQISYSTTDGTGGAVNVENTGSLVGSATTLNFTGSSVTDITISGNVATIELTGGGGGGTGSSGSSGSSGTAGSSGVDGSSGSSGIEGYIATWEYSSNTIIEDPTPTFFRLNAAWTSTPTQIVFDDIPYFPSGINLSPFLNALKVDSLLKLYSTTNPNNFKFCR